MLSSTPTAISVSPGVSISPGVGDVVVGVYMSPEAGAWPEQGGVDACPGSGGGQGPVCISPAKVDNPRTNVKTKAVPSLFRFFMVSP